MPSFCRFFGGLYSGDTELQVRVVAAMSSGEGAEETTKDASEIEAFFKTGKPSKSGRGRAELHGELPFGPAMRGTLFPGHVVGSGLGVNRRLQPVDRVTVDINEMHNKCQ